MKEALKLALEALTYIYTETTADEDELIDQAITALRLAIDVQNITSESTYKAALAQPAQEPTGMLHIDRLDKWLDASLKERKAQRTWVELAPEDRLCAKYMLDAPEGIEAVIDYITAKLKELNT